MEKVKSLSIFSFIQINTIPRIDQEPSFSQANWTGCQDSQVDFTPVSQHTYVQLYNITTWYPTNELNLLYTHHTLVCQCQMNRLTQVLPLERDTIKQIQPQ